MVVFLNPLPVQPLGEPVPASYGFKAWAGDPQNFASPSIIAAGGALNMVRLYNPGAQPLTVSSASVLVTTAGATLTNVGFALYAPSTQALLTSSVNANGATATAFQGTGVRTVTFTPQTIAGGADVYVAFWFTGTTLPTLIRGAGSALASNMTLASPNLRFCTANTGLTTAAPATYTAQTALNVAYWVGVS